MGFRSRLERLLADGFPQFSVDCKQTARGERAYDIYSRLLKERIIFVTGPVEAPGAAQEDRDFLAAAHRILAEARFDADIWRTLTSALKEATGRKGKALFLPLRRALTGLDHGPDMGLLLPLIGRDEALARLEPGVETDA